MPYTLSVDKLDLSTLPRPTGYKILIAVAKFEEKKGSILLPDRYVDLENTAAIMGVVLEMGQDSYTDTKRFPNGPYCKVGDWIMFKVYSGTRFKVGEHELRLINDDQVEALLPDPSVVERI